MKKDTPTEVYKLKGREVLVKRDDLMGDGNTLPPWGKLAGIDRLLHRYINPKYPLIHFQLPSVSFRVLIFAPGIVPVKNFF